MRGSSTPLPPRAAYVLVRGRYLDQVTHCRFGGVVVESTHATSTEVACDAPSHQSGLARVGLSANGVDFVDGPRVYYESSRPRVDAVRPAVVVPGAQPTTVYVVGGPFAAVEGWRAELLIQGWSTTECAFASTTHVACAVAMEEDAFRKRRPPPARTRRARVFRQAGLWVLPDISVMRCFPPNGAAFQLQARRLQRNGSLVCDWAGVLVDAAPTSTGVMSCR